MKYNVIKRKCQKYAKKGKGKLKLKYLEADIVVVSIESTDVISTSQIGDGNDSDSGGWTETKEW